VSFHNQDYHTSRTLALLLHLEEFPDCYHSFLVYQLAEVSYIFCCHKKF
jgi:hypothetical protein